MAARRAIPTCAICEDEDSGEGHVVTLCGHVFHESCIARWDRVQNQTMQFSRCPMCHGDLLRIIPDPRGRNRPLSFYVPLFSVGELPPDPVITRLDAIVRTQTENILSLQRSSHTLSDEKKALEDSLQLEQNKRIEQAAAAEDAMMKVAVEWSEAQAKFEKIDEQSREARCELIIKAFELQDASDHVLRLIAEGVKLRQSNTQLEDELKNLSSTNKTLVERDVLLKDKEKNEAAALGKLQEKQAQLGIESSKLRSTVQTLEERDLLAKEEIKYKATVIQQLQESSAKLEFELKELKSTIKERDAVSKELENKHLDATIQTLEQNHALLVLNLKNSRSKAEERLDSNKKRRVLRSGRGLDA